jgi:hypothetical protein
MCEPTNDIVEPSADTDQDEWRDRFRAVAKAQGRYLWLLLFAGVFYIALDRSVSEQERVPEQGKVPTEQAGPPRQQVPLIGVELSSRTVWASGSLVLGFIALTTLGTFPALTHAYSRANPSGESKRCFECLDTEPNAIDFAVYTLLGTPKWKKLGLAAYPLFITIIVGEAAWLWSRLVQSRPVNCSEAVFLLLGAPVTAASIYRLAQLWRSKLCDGSGGKEPCP